MLNLFANFHIQPHDIADIILVSLFIYFILLFIKQTRSYFIFNSVILLIVISYISQYFDLALTRKLFEPILTFFLVIFVVVFQREIRRFFRWLNFRRSSSLTKRTSGLIELCNIISDAVIEMAKQKSGAIIVLPGEYPLEDFTEGGFALDGKVSVPLLLSIFDHYTPGHDGAVLIENNRIHRFGVHLPLAENFAGFAKVGTRHRAASGITERTDAMAIVVSEERGTISIAEHGTLRSVEGRDALQEIIKKFLNAKEIDEKETVFHYLVFNNMWQKISSLIIAALLWFILVFQANITTRDIVVPLEFKQLPDSVQVDKVTPATIDITVSGDNQDVSTLTANDVRAIVNLDGIAPGTQQITVSSKNVNYPKYLTLIKIAPTKFSVTVSSTTKPIQ